jgi:hypothetical protein
MKKFQYTINLLLKDNNISAQIKSMLVNFGSLDQTIVSINERLRNVNFGAIVQNTKNAAEAFDDLSESGMGFEQAMADFKSITGIVGEEFEKIRKVARQVGKDSGLGATGAANAFSLLAGQIEYSKIGMEGLITLQKKTITLAQAGGITMEEAATAMAATINQYALEATEAERVINVLAAASKVGGAEIADLTQSLKVAGGTASAAGISLEATAGAVEVLSQANLKGSESGTALRNIILKMQTELGYNFGEIPLSTALESLKPKLEDINFLTKTFGVMNVNAAQFLIANASAVDELTAAVTGTNTAQEQAAIRTDTAAEKAKRMAASVEDMKISFFEATGGASAYASVIADNATVITSLIPIIGGLRSAIVFLTAANTQAAIATAARTVVEKASVGVTMAVATVQSALNAIISLNPFALIVVAIAALVAILIEAYKNSETFRNIVDKCWVSIKNFAAMIWDNLVKAFDFLSVAVYKVRDALKNLFGIEPKVAEGADKLSDTTKELAGSEEDAAKATEEAETALKEKSYTIAELERKISELKDEQKSASMEEAIRIENEIRGWESKLNIVQKTLAAIRAAGANLNTIGGLEQKIAILQETQKTVAIDRAVAIGKEIHLLEERLQLLKDSVSPEPDTNTIEGLEQQISRFKDRQKKAAVEEAAALGIKIKALERELELMNSLVAVPPNTDTIAGVEEQIASLQKKQKDTTIEEATSLGVTIKQLEKRLKLMQESVAAQPDLDTLGGIEQQITVLKEKQKDATIEEAAALSGEIQTLERKLQLMRQAVAIKPDLSTLGGVEQQISDLKAKQKTASFVDAVALEKEIKVWESALEQMQDGLSKAAPKLVLPGSKEMFSMYQEGVGGIASILQSLSGALGDSAGAWVQWSAGVIQAIAQAIPQIVALGNAQVMTSIQQTVGNTATAASGAAASVAGIPLVGPVLAIAAIASIVGALAAFPKPKRLATGGLAYGSVFANVGEYPGASNNPEVIAPLSKLRDMIEPQSSGFGRVEFEISGRVLKGILRKIDNIDERTR